MQKGLSLKKEKSFIDLSETFFQNETCVPSQLVHQSVSSEEGGKIVTGCFDPKPAEEINSTCQSNSPNLWNLFSYDAEPVVMGSLSACFNQMCKVISMCIRSEVIHTAKILLRQQFLMKNICLISSHNTTLKMHSKKLSYFTGKENFSLEMRHCDEK